MGHRLCQLLATICVASSLTVVAPGGSDPTTMVGPIWVAISHDVKGVSYEESGDA
jgi:hypothetical protein